MEIERKFLVKQLPENLLYRNMRLSTHMSVYIAERQLFASIKLRKHGVFTIFRQK